MCVASAPPIKLYRINAIAWNRSAPSTHSAHSSCPCCRIGSTVLLGGFHPNGYRVIAPPRGGCGCFDPIARVRDSVPADWGYEFSNQAEWSDLVDCRDVMGSPRGRHGFVRSAFHGDDGPPWLRSSRREADHAPIRCHPDRWVRFANSPQPANPRRFGRWVRFASSRDSREQPESDSCRAISSGWWTHHPIIGRLLSMHADRANRPWDHSSMLSWMFPRWR